MEVFDSPSARKLSGFGELVGDGDDIGRFTVRVQSEHRVEDRLVLGNVEVHAAHGFDDVGNSILAQEHSADGTLFGKEVVWGNAIASRAATRFAGLAIVAGKA